MIKEAVTKRHTVVTERFQAPPRAASAFVRKKGQYYPKSWVGVVSGIPTQTKDTTPTKVGSDGAATASAASTTLTAKVAAPVRALAKSRNYTTQPVVLSLAPIAHLTHPMDLANMVASSIEAALKPLAKKMEATIIPMQRSLESLQTEFERKKKTMDLCNNPFLLLL